jgi:cardiolipin synthase A/B
MALIFQRHFPWREDNHFQLLVDGGEIFPAMLTSIRAARSQILLEMYLVESGALLDRFIDALADAVLRGVSVYALFDGYGARGLSAGDRQRLKRAGIHLAIYNPIRFGKIRSNLLRDHRKLLVVDAQRAFVGGMGLTDVFDETVNPQTFWHDAAVCIEGPVAMDWHVVFYRNWRHWAKQHLPPVGVDMTEMLSGQAGRVAGGRRFGALSIHSFFLKRVRNAERHVWMMTAYFVPSHSLLRALRNAARRDVDVRLVLPGPKIDHPAVRYAGQQYYYSLLRAGVRIFEYQPRFLHAKVLMCDDWVSLGSSNVDSWNLRWNLEANQEIENSGFAMRTRELFEADFIDSEECQLETWQMRPRYRRALEWFWGRVAKWLEKMGGRIRRRK